MKKGLTLFIAAALMLSVSVTPVAAKSDNGKSTASSSQKETKSNSSSSNGSSSNGSSSAAADDSTDVSDNSETSSQKTKTNNKANSQADTQADTQADKKVFKDELNEKKKELQKEKSSLNQQIEALQLQYENMLAAGDEEGAAAILEDINALNEQVQGVQAQIKETINERYMVVKTMYTDEELAEFTSAKDLITQMYADAEVLSAGSVTINNNLIKFDTPAYIKNGVTLVPLRAISEELGGEVSWDAETQTVTITNGDTVVKITANSTTGTVNGEAVEISVPATKSCGRTYVPLRFLAEALGFHAEWDSENELIDITGGTETTVEEASADSTETTTVEETPTDSTETATEETAGDSSTGTTVAETGTEG